MKFTATIRRLFTRATYGHPFIWSALVPIIIGLSFFLNHKDVFENDVFLHTVLGKWILAGGSINGSPEWTYGPYQPGWINTMAVPEVVFATLYNWAGWGGLALVSILAVPAFLTTMWIAMTKSGPRPAASRNQAVTAVPVIAMTILAFLLQAVISVRPQAWSMVIVPIVTLAMIRIIHTGRFPKILPTVLGTWVMSNWHGYALLIAPAFAVAGVIHVVAGTLLLPVT
jgi:hypothetical protein